MQVTSSKIKVVKNVVTDQKLGKASDLHAEGRGLESYTG